MTNKNTPTVDLSAVSFDGLISAIMLGADIDAPTVFLGTYGIAKSAGVRVAAAAMGYVVVDYRASEILPEDVGGIGIPEKLDTGAMVVTRAIPDIVAACYKAAADGNKVMLFLDEITSALPSVQAALFQVFLDRKAGMCDLPPDTYVVAAGNLATDRSVVEELARPLTNRAMLYKYTGPTAEEFKRYMVAESFHPVVQTFLEVHPNYICDMINPDHEQSPTPRSLEVASNALKSPRMNRKIRMTAIASTLGSECAAKLEAFLTINDGLVSYRDIIESPSTVPLPPVGDFATSYMQMLAVAQGINRRLSEDAKENRPEVAAVWTYVKRMPVELGALWITSLQSPAVQAMLSDFFAELETLHDGRYAKVLHQLV